MNIILIYICDSSNGIEQMQRRFHVAALVLMYLHYWVVCAALHCAKLAKTAGDTTSSIG